MKKFILIILSVLVVQIGYAQTQQITTTTTTTDVSINSAESNPVDEVNARLIITPFLCDYSMITKDKDGIPIAVYDSIASNLLVRTILKDAASWIENYKHLVIAKMMKKYGADAILTPTTEAKTSDKGTLIVIVRGYPVKYINFRVANKDDEWMWKWDTGNTGTITTSTGKATVVK